MHPHTLPQVFACRKRAARALTHYRDPHMPDKPPSRASNHAMCYVHSTLLNAMSALACHPLRQHHTLSSVVSK